MNILIFIENSSQYSNNICKIVSYDNGLFKTFKNIESFNKSYPNMKITYKLSQITISQQLNYEVISCTNFYQYLKCNKYNYAKIKQWYKKQIMHKNMFKFQDYKHLKTFLNNQSYCILSDNGKDNIIRTNELYNYIDYNNLVYSKNTGYYNNVKENSYMLLYPDKTDIINFARDILKQDSIIFKDKNTLKSNSSFDLIYLDKDNSYTTFYDKLIIKKHGFNDYLGYGTIVKCLDGNIYDFVFS